MSRLVFLLAWLWCGAALAQSTQIGVVYGTDTGQVRRVIVPDNDAELNQPLVGPHESLLIIAKDADIVSSVQKATGMTPKVMLEAIVDKGGMVTSVIVADPDLDKFPGGVAAFPGVAPGQTYDAVSKTFMTAPVTYKAGTPDPDDPTGTTILTMDKVKPPAPVPVKPLEDQKVTLSGLQAVGGKVDATP